MILGAMAVLTASCTAGDAPIAISTTAAPVATTTTQPVTTTATPTATTSDYVLSTEELDRIFVDIAREQSLEFTYLTFADIADDEELVGLAHSSCGELEGGMTPPDLLTATVAAMNEIDENEILAENQTRWFLGFLIASVGAYCQDFDFGSDLVSDLAFILVMREKFEKFDTLTFMDLLGGQQLVDLARGVCSELDQGSTIPALNTFLNESIDNDLFSQNANEAASKFVSSSVIHFCDNHLDALSDFVGVE